MATIEVTAAIRRDRDSIYNYLHDLSNYRNFLPEDHFDDFASGDAVEGRNAAKLKWRALGRWWDAQLELDSDTPPESLVIKTPGASLPFTWTWKLSELKKDRRSERTEVHLTVDADIPGGAVGRLLGETFLERSMIKTYDQVMRRLEETLAGKPRSGLRPARARS